MEGDKWFGDEELGQIRKLNESGLNDMNIAEIIGRSRVGVRRNRIRLGLPARTIHTSMSERKKADSLLATMAEQTGGAMNYAYVSNRTRSAQIGWPDYPLSEALILYVLGIYGALETPQIIDFVGKKKAYENWKPHSMSHSRFSSCVSSLGQGGMVEKVYNGRSVPDRRKLPRKYVLTKKAEGEKRSRKVGGD